MLFRSADPRRRAVLRGEPGVGLVLLREVQAEHGVEAVEHAPQVHEVERGRALRGEVRHSIVVSAGDLIGASPLISGLFHDEPTVEAADILGLSFNAVGNHELDDGADELLRIQHGGCHPVDGCATDQIYPGARFRILAANVIETATGDPLFPGSAIRRFGAARIGFIDRKSTRLNSSH